MNFDIVRKHRSGPKRSYINMRYTDDILDKLLVVLATATTPEPSGMVLIGDSGVGKSSIISLFASEANKELDNEKAVIRVHTHNVRTLNAIYTSVLQSLGDIAPAKGKEHEKRLRIIALIANLNVQMIFFDDFHHVVEQRGREAARAIVDEIKMIKEESHVATVFVGVKSLANVGLINEQIDTRYNAIVEIPALNIKSEDDVKDLRAFLTSYIDHHGIKLSFDIKTMDNIYHVYAATRGVLRVIVNLIKTAKLLADNEGCEVVTKTHFKRVIETASLRHLRVSKNKKQTAQDDIIYQNTTVTPFSSSVTAIKSAIGL